MKARVPRWILSLVGSIALFARAADASPWIEQGDAGNTSSPQTTLGSGVLTEIHGLIGTPGTGDPDSVDAFLFAYGGAPGLLHITAAFDDPSVGFIGGLLLFDDDGNEIVGLSETVDVTDLAAGLYIIEVVVDDDAGDPPYTIFLAGPAGEGGAGFAGVPEPATAWLLGAALALGLVRGARA